MTWQTLDVVREGPILRVWLDRPERRNALDTTALEEVTRLFAGLAADFETRVVVLGGRGAAFCAGADRKNPPAAARMASGSGATERERRHASQIGRRAARAIEEAAVPTIARIHGYAIGGGVVLAAACDFRVASEDAWLHVPEVDLGIPLTWGGTPRLVQEIGAARARELVLLCDRVDAATAERWGLLHRVVPAAGLDDAVDGIARRIAAKPEIAVDMTRTQFLSYARRSALGDVTETDGDVLMAASRVGVARRSFPAG